jgi:hypothetical protein
MIKSVPVLKVRAINDTISAIYCEYITFYTLVATRQKILYLHVAYLVTHRFAFAACRRVTTSQLI